MRSKSRVVNRYVEAVQKRRALAVLHQNLREEETAAHGALRGKHLREADAILTDVVRLATDYAVVLKIKVVRHATSRAKCSTCGGSGRDTNPHAGTETCGACAGTGKATKAVVS